MLKLSEDSKKTKAKLLVLSGVSLFIALSEALPTKVAILGLDLSKNEMITGWFVLAVTVYFLAYFIILSALNVIEYYLPSYIANKTENITGDTIGLTKEECSPEDEDQYEYERGTTSGEMFEISRKSKIITYRYSNGFQRLSNYSTFMFEILLPVIFSVVSLMYLLCFLHHRQAYNKPSQRDTNTQAPVTSFRIIAYVLLPLLGALALHETKSIWMFIYMKDAKTLARNPLGIVALFISLIYGFATLLLNSSVDKLCPLERWPLILFIVSFPFAVLFVFYKLVTNHHGKLYSPSDYKDDGSFLQTLSPAEQETKLEMDANEALGNIFIENKPVEGSENLSKTKQRILKVEEFVTDLISKELGIKAETHSKVGVGDKGIVYDAIYVKPRESLVALEVKYYSVPRITIKSIDAFINKITATHEYMSIDTMFILAIVYEGKEKEYEVIFDAWRSRIQNTSIKIDLRLINGREVQG